MLQLYLFVPGNWMTYVCAKICLLCKLFTNVDSTWHNLVVTTYVVRFAWLFAASRQTRTFYWTLKATSEWVSWVTFLAIRHSSQCLASFISKLSMGKFCLHQCWFVIIIMYACLQWYGRRITRPHQNLLYCDLFLQNCTLPQYNLKKQVSMHVCKFVRISRWIKC